MGDPEIASRIAAYEMAFRMQASAPELIDLDARNAGDARSVRSGAGQIVVREYLPCSPAGWSSGAFDSCPAFIRTGTTTAMWSAISRKSAAQPIERPPHSIADLKQRGLLDETLVVWGGEFGRTPMVENNPALGRLRGRDHHPDAFTMWFAGGGIKGGQTIGATDDLGYHVTRGSRSHSRFAGDDPAFAGNQPRSADLSLSRSRFPIDRRRRHRCQKMIA